MEELEKAVVSPLRVGLALGGLITLGYALTLESPWLVGSLGLVLGLLAAVMKESLVLDLENKKLLFGRTFPVGRPIFQTLGGPEKLFGVALTAQKREGKLAHQPMIILQDARVLPTGEWEHDYEKAKTKAREFSRRLRISTISTPPKTTLVVSVGEDEPAVEGRPVKN